jgi:hypothetical protein
MHTDFDVFRQYLSKKGFVWKYASNITKQKSYANTTLKCILVHFGFHYILNEFGHFYHGETSQPPSEHGLVIMDNELVH